MATKKQTNKVTSKSKTYYSRKFLNKDKGRAAIEFTFEFNPEWMYHGGWDANVVIPEDQSLPQFDAIGGRGI